MSVYLVTFNLLSTFLLSITLNVFMDQGLMREAEKTPNVVMACNKPGLYDELEDLQKRYVRLKCVFEHRTGLIGFIVSYTK